MSTFPDASNPLDTDRLQAVLTALQQQDQLLTQGTLTYRRHFQRASREGVFAEVGTDSNERRVIRSKEDMKRLADGPTNSLEDGEIIVTKEGHLWHRETKLDLQTGEPLADRTIIHIYDGQDERILLSKQVTLTANRFSDRRERSIYGLYPAPCYALGRGLSLLQNIRIEQRDGTLTLTGSRNDKTHIEAELDAAHSYLATKIVEKRADGTVGSTMELDTPIEMGVCFVASHSFHASFYRTPTEPMLKDEYTVFSKDEYTVFSADIQPRDVDFSPLLKKGTIVMDCRVTRAVRWEIESDQTPAQLLPQSQKKFQEQKEREAKREEKQRQFKAEQGGDNDGI